MLGDDIVKRLIYCSLKLKQVTYQYVLLTDCEKLDLDSDSMTKPHELSFISSISNTGEPMYSIVASVVIGDKGWEIIATNLLNRKYYFQPIWNSRIRTGIHVPKPLHPLEPTTPAYKSKIAYMMYGKLVDWIVHYIHDFQQVKFGPISTSMSASNTGWYYKIGIEKLVNDRDFLHKLYIQTWDM